MSNVVKNDLGFDHQFVPAANPAESLTLLLLHGTGGNEFDLLPLGHILASSANLLSPRGNVLENGIPRFFRRLSEGVFDQEDLKYRTQELAVFLEKAAASYGFNSRTIIAAGYSNGANIAASLLMRHPERLAGALLFHPMVPFVPDGQPELSRTPIFIGAGRNDPIVPTTNTEQLATLLRAAEADVTVFWHSGGHSLTSGEAEAAQQWLLEKFR